MEKNKKILLVALLIISLALFLYNIYVGLMALILFAALIMSIKIAETSSEHPDIEARLSDDAKGIELRNRGNAPAFNIHVAVVPINIEFDIPSLKEEEEYLYSFEAMIEEAKVVVTFENERGLRDSESFIVSALARDEDDFLKPVFPMFGWKKKK
ncbi:MAG: hypothetical protein GKC05_00300 [Methanomicrobiales archaeon]|nr:hypothetical protein [Methanomicrobiales archaeon]NYT21364.1 hypothetical protein [Methanomicrobiales archaeon]